MSTHREPSGTTGPPDSGPRRRADWTSARARILTASSELFAAQGYRRTSTAELATAAGVAEATLFRHFPTKAALFEQAVIAPFRATVDEIAETRLRRAAVASTRRAAYDFYVEILKVLDKDRGLLIAALAALTFEAETSEFGGLTAVFKDLLDYMDQVVAAAADQRGFTIDPLVGSRMMLALALGLSLGRPLLFEGQDRPTPKQLATQMALLTAYGLPGGPGDAVGQTRPPRSNPVRGGTKD